MANLFERAFGVLTSVVQPAAKTPAEFLHEGQLVGTVDVVVANAEIESLDEEGFVIRAQAIDLLIRSEQLRVMPAPGDCFRLRRGVRLVTYEVTRFGQKPAVEPADPYHLQQRVHTKQIKIE